MNITRRAMVSVVLLLTCCAQQEAPDAAPDASPPEAGTAVIDAAPPACVEGATRACACGDAQLGLQTCSAGEFGSCAACYAAASAGPRCAAGTYRGHVHGTYRSEPSGVCGLLAGDEGALDFDIVFTLLADGDGEFYTVQGGCLRVPGEEELSSDADTSVGLTFELSGGVDCATGAVDITWNGTYVSKSVCMFGLGWERYFTRGTISGSFDPDTGSFVDSTWLLRERVPVLGGEPTGGQGTFTAELDADAGAPDTRTGRACLGVDFPDDLTPQPVDGPP